METSYAPPLEISRWRTATILVSLLAVAELVALLAIGTTYLGKVVVHHVEIAAAAKVAAPIRPHGPPRSVPESTSRTTAAPEVSTAG